MKDNYFISSSNKKILMPTDYVNGAVSVHDQKTPKFLSHVEEYRAGHIGINGVY
jgi:hypothetical protein